MKASGGGLHKSCVQAQQRVHSWAAMKRAGGRLRESDSKYCGRNLRFADTFVSLHDCRGFMQPLGRSGFMRASGAPWRRAPLPAPAPSTYTN